MITAFDSRFETRREQFSYRGFDAVVELPLSSEALIDEAEFDQDERLPYWAELWPSARALAKVLLDRPALSGSALELGCGVALPSLALLHRGIGVLATDYYPEALDFARRNAALNGLANLRTGALDWRQRPEGLGRFPLVVAADVLYESRNVDALVALLPETLAPGGEFLFTDPDRTHLSRFLDELGARGWGCERLPDVPETSSAVDARPIMIRVYSCRPIADPG